MRSYSAIVACWTALGGLCAAAQTSASPLSPDAERATFHLADSNLVVELVASEPNVRAPVALAWDPAGRMYVAEMTDYPSGPVSGRIRLLEDLDHDGVFERATIFATNLAFPNGVFPWRKGVLVTAAPDIWYLADTNGDRVADLREKVLTGFAEGNQQLRVNGLFWGIDNWIYGANGRSDGEARWADNTTAGSIRRRDFRFRPGTHEFEPIAGQSQFGMGHDEWGNRFPVFNNNPVRHVVMEDRWLERQPLLAGTEVVASISPAVDGTRVFARTPPALLIPQPVGFYTSACGPSIYRGDVLPAEYQGNAFVCEPVQNLIQRRILEPSGATFIASYAHTNSEFLAASDPWFHGVFTATGPDGAFYIVDMYREWVEHPHWVAPEIRDKVDWRKGEEHGRIWRVRARDSKRKQLQDFAAARNDALLAALESPNGWVRDTAHQQLFERNAASALPELRRVALASALPQARIHALHLISSFDPNPDALVAQLITNAHPRVREQAISVASMLIGRRPEPLVSILARRAGAEGDARARLQLAFAYGSFSDASLRQSSLASLCEREGLDEWQIVAVLSSAGPRPWLTLREVTGRNLAREMPLIVEKFAPAIAAASKGEDVRVFLDWLSAWDSPGRLLAFAAFVYHPKSAAALKNASPAAMDALRSHAETALSNRGAELSQRIAGLHVLARLSARDSASVLSRLLDPGEPEMIQSSAARALADMGDAAITRSAFDRWKSLPRAARQQLLASAARNPVSAAALFDSIERGGISLIEVDATTRQGIQRLQKPEIKSRGEKLFAEAVSNDREEVVQKYKPALQADADRHRGALVFEKNCAVCHQMQGVGAKIGPDLSGIGTQTRESLLVQILDPSRQVLPDFVAYQAEMKGGDSYTGFIVGETAATVTLRRANEADITLARSDLAEFKTSGKSLMPDGFEAAMTIQDMADLIEFLRRPDRTLFTSANLNAIELKH